MALKQDRKAAALRVKRFMTSQELRGPLIEKCRALFKKRTGREWTHHRTLAWRGAWRATANDDQFENRAFSIYTQLAEALDGIEAFVLECGPIEQRRRSLPGIVVARTSTEANSAREPGHSPEGREPRRSNPTLEPAGWRFSLLELGKSEAFEALIDFIEKQRFPAAEPVANDEPQFVPSFRNLARMAQARSLTDRDAAVISILLKQIPKPPKEGFTVSEALAHRTNNIRGHRNRLKRPKR